MAAFRTDVSIRAPASQPHLDRPNSSRGLSSSEYLDNAAESVNRQIDTDVKAMLDAFEALVGLSRIRDKDKFRIAQETFELEARADVMVRAAQSLTLLSHSLKLSLLLSQEPIDSADGAETSLDEEAAQLIRSTARERQRCADILEEMFDLEGEDEDSSDEGEGGKEGKEEQNGETAAGQADDKETAWDTGDEGVAVREPIQAGNGVEEEPVQEQTLALADEMADEEDLEMEEVVE